MLAPNNSQLMIPNLQRAITPETTDGICSKVTVMILSFQTFVWANSADPYQTAPQGLHCLQFHLHLSDALFYGKATLFEF